MQNDSRAQDIGTPLVPPGGATADYASARASSLPQRGGMPRLQELGLIIVIVVLATVLSLYGWHDARPGQPNTFLNFDNIIDGIATPMSYYAIMAVGVTIVIITSGIDISVGSTMALAALGGAAVLQQ